MEMTLVEFAGEIDVFQSREISDAVEAAARLPDIQVCLARLAYLDSTLLNALVRLRRMRLDAGFRHPIPLFGASFSVRRIFSVTGLDELFTIMPAGQLPEQPGARVIRVGGCSAKEDAHSFL